MILLTLSRGKGEETVRLQLPASPAEIGETFAFLDRISLDTTATAILDVSSNVPVLYRCLYDVDVEDSEQFQKLQKLAERTEALSPAKAAIFSGALDAECVWNLEGALTVADRLDEYMLVNNVSSDSELGIYLVNKGIIPFPDRFKPYINYARVGAEYREKHGGEYSSGNYVQKKTPELLENERLDGVFRIWMENPCPVRVQSETAQITLPATFEQLESARQLLGVDSLNMAKLTRVEALRPYLGEYLPLQGMDLRLEQLDELAENIRIMDQEDGALLKYLSVLEVEQPATLQEALRFSIELDDYPPYNEVQARELIDCLREIAPYVVIDCGSYIANDILSAVALMEADSVLRLANADLKSISYLSSQLPLLRDAKWDTDKQYKTASNVKSQQAGDHMSQALGTVAFTLPHSAELEGQYLAGNLLADLSMKDSRVFRKEIEKIAREVFGC